MTLISKAAITLIISIMSVFVFHKPPAPTPAEKVIRYEYTVDAVPVPAIPSTTATTQPDAPKTLCEQVFDTAKAIGWPADQLGMLVAVAQRESRCQPNAFNATDPNGGSHGIMQINGFWCEPSRYWPNGYLQAYGLLTECIDLYDRETNLRAALAIYRYSNGWRAWGK
jgi:Lysozyme like domain